MNKENTEKLYTDFPELYKQKDLAIQQSCMPWGFECGDGWYDLLYELSKDLSELDHTPQACQVKEKFGTLRFYVDYDENTTDLEHVLISELINAAEIKSATTCDICGEDGKTRSGGWVSTRCEEHV